MELWFRKSGSGNPLIILHGLYGSSSNWYSIGRELSKDFEVYLIDQRNHGKSFHHPLHNYDAMRDDLYEFFISHRIEHAILVGHSMGGKTAMSFALKYQEMVDRLIVIDISPVDYNNKSHAYVAAIHRKIISTLQLIDPALIRNREEADKMLQTSIPQENIRQFLLKNLKRKKNGKYRWILNVEALAQNIVNISAGIIPAGSANTISVTIPALFIKGEYSNYIREEDEAIIFKLFPSAHIAVIPGTGHWLHVDKPTLFLKSVHDFISG